MINQEFVVNEETLTDGSKVYNVVAFDGKNRITLHLDCKHSAEDTADILNDGRVVGFSIDTLR